MFGYFATSCLWFGFGALGVIFVTRQLRELIPTQALRLGALVTLPLAATVVLATSFHWGLEYEDAFEYEYAARFLAHDPESRSSGLTPVCLLLGIGDQLVHPTAVEQYASDERATNIQ